MSTRSRSSQAGGRRGRKQPAAPAWSETEEEGLMPDSLPAAGRSQSDSDDLRQLAARRRLEQYLEGKRLREHLQEIFYEDER